MIRITKEVIKNLPSDKYAIFARDTDWRSGHKDVFRLVEIVNVINKDILKEGERAKRGKPFPRILTIFDDYSYKELVEDFASWGGCLEKSYIIKSRDIVLNPDSGLLSIVLEPTD